jgi:hypothetical protein
MGRKLVGVYSGGPSSHVPTAGQRPHGAPPQDARVSRRPPPRPDQGIMQRFSPSPSLAEANVSGIAPLTFHSI